MQGEDEVCQGIDWEVFPQCGGGGFCLPVQGEVTRGEAFCEMPGRVLGSKDGGGEEGGRQASGWRVSRRGGTGDPAGRKAPSVPAVGGDGGKTSFEEQN